MKVQQERINSILEIYKPDWRYLVEANVDYPKAIGKFLVYGEAYTTERVEHITVIDAGACLNQLCFSAFGEWFSEGRFERTMSFKKFFKLMKENMFVIDTNTRFRKPIPTNREIYGQVELTKIKKHEGLYLAFLNYNLEQGKSKGNLELALKL
jgi:hypothetical protein